MTQCFMKLQFIHINYNDREEGPFNIKDVKRVLYRQPCLEEYNAEIENNVESFMQTWVYVYEELEISVH